MNRKSIINWVGLVSGPVLPIAFILLWPCSLLHRVFVRRTGQVRVLLVARNSIAANHLECISDLLKEDPRIIQFATTDRVPAEDFDKTAAAEMVGVSGVHIFRALVCHWDLVVFSNHAYGFGVCFSPFITKLYVNHGIHSGKINNALGQDGVYGRMRVIRPFRAPYYDVMFAASHYEKDYAISNTPELEGRVKVAGFLRSDIFEEYAATQREAIRSKLGFGPDDKVVHLISTWGANSLYSRFGDLLLRWLEDSMDEYKVVLSLHPRFDDLTVDSNESRNAILLKFRRLGVIVNSGLDWEDYVASSDVAISDHSSLCLYHVLLSHPILLADVEEDQYVPGSNFAILKKQCRVISSDVSMDQSIAETFDGTVKPDYSDAVSRMLDYRGGARARYLKEIHALLP